MKCPKCKIEMTRETPNNKHIENDEFIYFKIFFCEKCGELITKLGKN